MLTKIITIGIFIPRIKKKIQDEFLACEAIELKKKKKSGVGGEFQD